MSKAANQKLMACCLQQLVQRKLCWIQVQRYISRIRQNARCLGQRKLHANAFKDTAPNAYYKHIKQQMVDAHVTNGM